MSETTMSKILDEVEAAADAVIAERDRLERANAALVRDRAELVNGLSEIKWIKDCGVDGRDETGKMRNWPETERDAMYEIAARLLTKHRSQP